MAFSAAQAFGGLAQGLSEGIATGTQLAQRQQQIELQQAEGKLKIASAFANLKKMPLEMRKIVAPGLMDQFEKAYNIPIPETVRALAIKGEDAQWAKAMDVMSTYITTGKGTPQELSAAAKAFSDDPEQQLKFFATLSQRGESRERIALGREELDVRKQELEREATRKVETAAAQAHRDILDNASKNLTGPGVTDYETRLEANPAYRAARQRGDSQMMYSIATKIRQGIPPEFYATKGQQDIGVIQELRTKYEEAARTETDPVKQKKYQELADLYARKERFGGKEIPQTHLDFLESSSTATTWISKTADILGDPKRANVLSPKDRAELAQSVQGLKLELATLNKRGANFTDQEQKMIEATMGGDPNSIISRGLRNREDFLARLKTIHGVIQAKVESRERALIGGKATLTPFPSRSAAPTTADPGKEVGDLLERGAAGPQFKNRNPNLGTMPNATFSDVPEGAQFLRKGANGRNIYVLPPGTKNNPGKAPRFFEMVE